MALMASLTIALAGSTQGGDGNNALVNGKANGNGEPNNPVYRDLYGFVFRIGKLHWGASGQKEGQERQDSFTCTAQPAGATLTGVYPGQPLTLATITGWSSDYDAVAPLLPSGLRLQRCSERGPNQLYCRSQLLRRVHTPKRREVKILSAFSLFGLRS